MTIQNINNYQSHPVIKKPSFFKVLASGAVAALVLFSQHSQAQLLTMREDLVRFDKALWRNMGAEARGVCPLPLSPFAPSQSCAPLPLLEESLKRSARRTSWDFDNLAKFGNKHRNLVKMQALASALSLNDLEIPLPFGLSSDQIVSFLEMHAPEVFRLWQELKNRDSKVLQKEEISLLDEIGRLIQKAFEKAGIDESVYRDLDLSAEMETWLEECKQNGQTLMVRSTGAEDSAQAANAGGNLSIAYVEPERTALCQAIGEVVQSYFGRQSLQNRLNAGIDPFSERLNLAVTTQVLIGESPDADSSIPTSFVLFTNEPLYVGTEKFRTMRVSASFGHGEGIVGNRGIATDSALILHSEANPEELYILYNNQNKPERLAPLRNSDGSIELAKVKNPPDLQQRRALDDKALLDLYRSGVLMEAFFNDAATDIEGVIQKGKVHFVQARPVNRKPLLPTYFDVEQAKEAIQQSLSAQMLVPGKAAALAISRQEEILFAPTLEEAERRYTSDSGYKLVVVTQPEPDNSHPVVNFSQLGIPCLYASDAEAVRNLIQSIDANRALAVCMQTATLHLCSTPQIEPFIREGFAVHPAKIGLSLKVPHEHSLERGAISEDLLALIRRLGSQSKAEALQTLEQIKKHSDIQSLLQKEKEFVQELQGMKWAPSAAQSLVKTLRALRKQIDQAIQETHAAIASSNDRLKTLFHIKALETALFGHPSPGQLSSYSLAHAPALIRDISDLILYQKNLLHPAHCIDLFLLGQSPYLTEVSRYWRQSLLDLESQVENGTITQEELQQFKLQIQALHKTGALSQQLIFQSQIASDLLPALTDLENLQQSLDQIHFRLDRFADPKQLPEARKEILSIIEALSSPAWATRVKSSSPTEKLAVVQTMDKVIDTLDRALKALKSSGQFPNDEVKAKLFKEMLLPYFQMIEHWMSTLVAPGALPLHENWSVQTYLNQMKWSLTGLPETSASLLPSRDFSVQAAILGSATTFGRHLPETLEDMLTLLHQNGLVAINALNQEIVPLDTIQNSRLPSDFKKVIAQIEQTNWGRTVQRTGISSTSRQTLLRYNVPLRNHSGRFDLSLDHTTGKIHFNGHFIGDARTRWPQISIWLKGLERADLYALDQPVTQTEQELSFSWTILPNQINSAMGAFLSMAELSMTQPARLRVAVQQLHAAWNFQPPSTNELENVARQILEARLLSSTDPLERLDLFRYFVEKNLYLQEAIQAAKSGMQRSDSDPLSEASFDLFSDLIEKGFVIEEAIQFAESKMQNSDYLRSISEEFKNSYKPYMHQGRFYGEDVRKEIISRMLNKEWFFRLLMKLIDKGFGIEKIIEVAKSAAQNSHYFIREISVSIFERLITRRFGIKEALEVAESMMHHPVLSIRDKRLFEILVAKGYITNEPIRNV